MYRCIPTPTTDSNTSTGMIWVALNMPSAAEECREPSGTCQGISHCLESGHHVSFQKLRDSWASSSLRFIANALHKSTGRRESQFSDNERNCYVTSFVTVMWQPGILLTCANWHLVVDTSTQNHTVNSRAGKSRQAVKDSNQSNNAQNYFLHQSCNNKR